MDIKAKLALVAMVVSSAACATGKTANGSDSDLQPVPDSAVTATQYKECASPTVKSGLSAMLAAAIFSPLGKGAEKIAGQIAEDSVRGNCHGEKISPPSRN
ncbi:MAG: hypothetical protein AUJ12_07025 [Alphaproteobacteria bacterium CG1_02_46_17]|nr:MAG: hypothetical protein AUJ12_07025 [Alphaproteobacteria bacterium CG1_02_46_17]